MNTRKKPLLIVLIAGIGDLVLASKSIRAIRKGFPDADIHLLTSTEAAPIAQNYNYLEHVWAFPIRELRKKKRYLFDILRLILRLRKIEFGIAVNLFSVDSWLGAMKMGLLFLLLKSQSKVGHDSKGFGLFLTKKVPSETFQNRHRVDAMNDIALQAGGRPGENGIDVFWDKRGEKKWSHVFESKALYINERIVGLNPGGDRENRRWNPEDFAIVGDKIIEEFDAKIVLLGGPGEENIAGQIERKMRNGVVNLAGKLDVNELTYIISKFDLLVTNDSGPMHIAAGVKTPLVAIFGPQNPAIVGPYTSKKLYSVLYKEVNCRPCNKKRCDLPICLDLITPDEVYEKCAELLEANKSSPVK
ncbi:MAG: glycosyltransferase family 9 protein [Deltaproteobacteria bacterium]|nr:glycosyltransferase family 9 protein [Deltaproteobacteria bacterium]